MATKVKMFVSTFLLTLSLVNSEKGSLTIQELYQRLSDVVNSSPKPKGIPFNDYIPSPKSQNDRIAIVGAGPAGIHMAYLLKRKGFNNIIVLEKSNRIGGKSYTVHHRNVPHEMGTCYTNSDYEDNVIALAKEFGVWKPVPIPSTNIWLDKLQLPIPYSEYVIREVMKISGTQKPKIAVARLLLAMVKYSRLHRDLFGKYNGELMWKPAPSTMNILRCTFYEFLEKHNLTVLKPVLININTVQGYGHLDEIAALYGLMWNTPNFMRGFAGGFLGITSELNMIRGGFQGLWEAVKIRESINVLFNMTVTKLHRTKNGVLLKTPRRRRWMKFDFLIWTPSIYSYRHVLNASRKEFSIFSKPKPVLFTTTLFDSTYGKRGVFPIDYWISNIENKREHSVWAQRNSYGALNDQDGPAFQNGSLPGGPDGKFIRTGVAYQYGKRYMNESEIHQIFLNHFTRVNATVIKTLRSVTWSYFPKFSPNDMAAGVLWDIFEMQGSRRTWFAGSSVCFESVKSVLEYNKLLVSKMTETNGGTNIWCHPLYVRYIVVLLIHFICAVN